MDKKAISCESKDTLTDLGLTAVGDIISLRAFCDVNERNQEVQKLPSTTSTQSIETINERKRSRLEILEKGRSSRLKESRVKSKNLPKRYSWDGCTKNVLPTKQSKLD